MGMLAIAPALSQSVYSVEPPSKQKANEPYIGFSVSVPLVKVFKPIRALFTKKKIPISQSKPWEAEGLTPLNLAIFIPDPGYAEFDYNGGLSPRNPDYRGIPCNGCGGGGGSAGGGGSVPVVPADDKYRIPGYRNMDPQISNLCVPSVMAKVLQTMCHKDINVGALVFDYYRKYAAPDNNILQDGVPKERLIDFVSDYFNLNAGDIEMRGSMAEKVKADVLAGTPIMVGIIHYSGLGHNILVTGYNNTKSRFIILDPETGFESEMNTEQMNEVLYRVPLFCK